MNKVILIGRLTKLPELTFAQGTGNAICKFTIAVSRPFKKDETDFISCTAFGKKAETIAQYMDKGSSIAISGSIRTGSYDDPNGKKIYTTQVIIDDFEFVSSTNKKNQSNSDKNSSLTPAPSENFDNDFTQMDVEDDMPF